jgi:hypothetical protein
LLRPLLLMPRAGRICCCPAQTARACRILLLLLLLLLRRAQGRVRGRNSGCRAAVRVAGAA